MQPTAGAQTPRRSIFVDTQGWAEIFHAPALHHSRAVAFLQDVRASCWELITSNLILSELVKLLSELVPLLRSRNFRLPQPQILAIMSQIRALPNLIDAYIDPALDQQVWGLRYANPQQPWSHVDATSIALMRQLGITEVLTADHHFTQAGFTVLL